MKMFSIVNKRNTYVQVYTCYLLFNGFLQPIIWQQLLL